MEGPGQLCTVPRCVFCVLYFSQPALLWHKWRTNQPTSRAVSSRQQRRHNKPVMCDMHGMVASSLPRTGETPSSVSGHRMTAQLQLSSDFAVNCSEYAFWRCMAEVNHDPTPVYGDGEEEKYNFHNPIAMVYTRALTYKV